MGGKMGRSGSNREGYARAVGGKAGGSVAPGLLCAVDGGNAPGIGSVWTCLGECSAQPVGPPAGEARLLRQGGAGLTRGLRLADKRVNVGLLPTDALLAVLLRCLRLGPALRADLHDIAQGRRMALPGLPSPVRGDAARAAACADVGRCAALYGAGADAVDHRWSLPDGFLLDALSDALPKGLDCVYTSFSV